MTRPIALLCLLASGSLWSEDAKDTAPKPVPTPRLFWRNGQSLPGDALQADATTLTWRTDLVTEPVDLDVTRLDVLELPGIPNEKDYCPATWKLVLTNGDCLRADSLKAEGDSLVLKTARHGEVKVPVSLAAALYRRSGGDLLHQGPTGYDGWGPQTLPVIGGVIGTRKIGNRLQHIMPLPDKAWFSITLRSTRQPQFKLALESPVKDSPILAMWDQHLVLTATQNPGQRFTPLMSLGDQDRDVSVQLCWDRKARHVDAFDANGKALGSLDIVQPPPPNEKQRKNPPVIKDGIFIENTGVDLVLQQIAVRRWDGKPPPERKPGQPCAQLNSGTRYTGTIKISGEDVTIAGKTTPLSEIASIVWQDQLPPLVDDKPHRGAWFADGTMLHGTLSSLSADSLGVEVPWMKSPLPCLRVGSRRVIFTPADKPEKEQELGTLDKLRNGGITMHGQLEGSATNQPLWRFVGARKAVPIKVPETDPDIEIVRPERKDFNVASSGPHLLITSDNCVLRGEFHSLDETGVSFTSPWSSLRSLRHDQMRALDLVSQPSSPKGFRDPRWTVVKDTGKGGNVFEKKSNPSDDVLNLNPGVVVAHPSLLQGNDIRFRFKPNSYGGVRCTLYGEALEGSSANGMSVILYNSGSQFYVVNGSQQNMGVRSEQMLRNLERNGNVDIRFAFANGHVQIYANESRLLDVPLPKTIASNAFVMKSDSLWGNSPRIVQLTNFSISSTPGEIAPLAVPQQAKTEALTIPRSKRNFAPAHVLVAPNGDLIRGTAVAATKTLVRFESGMDSVDVPLDRVRSVVWLKPPLKTKGGHGPEDVPYLVQDIAPLRLEMDLTQMVPPPRPTHWVTLHDQSQLAMRVSAFTADNIIGRTAVCGDCSIAMKDVLAIRTKPPSATGGLRTFTDWQLVPAPEPVIPEKGGQASPLLGKAAPPFKLKMLDGSEFDLGKERGHVVVLDFWATWCGPCIASIPELLKVAEEFKSNKDVRVVGLNQGETNAVVSRFLKLRKWDFTVALDQDQKVAGQYGVDGIPHTVIVGRDGTVAWTSTGFSADGASKLKEAITKALEAKPGAQ